MDKSRTKEFVGKMFQDMAGAMTAGLVYIGVETGLFRAMAGQAPMNAGQVAKLSGLQARYVEEWLKGLVCAGYIEYEPEMQTYHLPEEHAFLLASDDTDHFAGGLFHFAPVLLGVAPKVADAFVNGGGVGFHEYGEHGMVALDLINRGNYEHRFASHWLQTLPEVVERLEAGAEVLDVGCGTGRVSMALASAFPNSKFRGVDLDAASVRQASDTAAARGLAGRVEFVAQPIGELDEDQRYDLITACDCIHDFSAPAQTLGEIRARLKSDGTLFVVEPMAADKLEDNINPIATMFYGFSVFHCMTQSLADGGPGLGTCMGPAQTKALLNEAGFNRFQCLDIKSQVNLFYAAGH